MANLAETPTFDAGVYQLELVDPVQGGPAGVSNKPLINLANRTAYLKLRVDTLEQSAAGFANANSPTFTGTPLTPKPALGDNSTKIPTTSWVQDTLHGVLNKSVAGGANVTLTDVEAGNGILNFTGLLTANIDVIVPNGKVSRWLVQNNTTGAFTLRVKTAAGAGVFVRQARRAGLWTDTTAVLPIQTDYTDLAMEGNPTAPTPAPGDSDTSVATTAFVMAALATVGLGSAVGAVLPFAGGAPPSGWLKANGAAISRAAYPQLFSLLGTSYGAGDNSTTFNLPDLRGIFIRGWDDGRGTDPSRAHGSMQAHSFASHSHTYADAGHGHAIHDPGHGHGAWTDAQGAHNHGYPVLRYGGDSDRGTLSAVFSIDNETYLPTDGNHGHNVTIAGSGANLGIYTGYANITINNTGGTETRPINMALLYCIKF